MSSIAYIETGLRYRLKRHDSPLLANISKLKDFLTLSMHPEPEPTATMNQARKELGDVGFSYFQLERRESRHIANYLHHDEHIRAAIRGLVKDVGGALVVATDSRVLYLHETPLFSSFEVFAYDIVSGISLNNVSRLLSSVSLFTKFKVYQLDYVNTRSAEQFLKYVESRLYTRDEALLHERERRMLMGKDIAQTIT